MILSTKTKIAIAKVLHRLVWVSRRAVGRSMRGVFVRDGIKWELDLNEGIDLSIHLMGTFEPATNRAYRSIIRPGDVVFDVGANMGAHTLPFSRLAGLGGQVHAFEPTLAMLAKLRRNCALNPGWTGNVIINHAFCAGSRQAVVPEVVYSSWPLDGSAADLHPTHLGRRNEVGCPQLVVLDEYVRDRQLSRIDLIKLDVDGNEIAVLQGAQEIMARFRPVILTEIAPYMVREYHGDMETFWSIFRRHGYRMRLLNSAAEIPLASGNFVRKLAGDSSVNVLFF